MPTERRIVRVSGGQRSYSTTTQYCEEVVSKKHRGGTRVIQGGTVHRGGRTKVTKRVSHYSGVSQGSYSHGRVERVVVDGGYQRVKKHHRKT